MPEPGGDPTIPSHSQQEEFPPEAQPDWASLPHDLWLHVLRSLAPASADEGQADAQARASYHLSRLQTLGPVLFTVTPADEDWTSSSARQAWLRHRRLVAAASATCRRLRDIVNSPAADQPLWETLCLLPGAVQTEA